MRREERRDGVVEGGRRRKRRVRKWDRELMMSMDGEGYWESSGRRGKD